jgi:uncharacterized coiled-coil DUF342 family protein
MNKLISCLLAAIMILGNSSFVQSAEKKDVSDPVLREIIAELSSTMPRFINKYGATVFVSDEQITRASLIQALYEYNKNKGASTTSAVTPSSNIGFVSKDDFNALKSKVSALEKKALGGTQTTAKSSSVSSNLDIIQLMNDLEPNMPMLLDNSLQNSKVFRDLQKKVDSRSVSVGGSSVAQSSGISEAQLESIKNDITGLSQKYETLSAALTSSRDSKMSSSQASANIAILQKEVAGINVKLASLQESVKNSGSSDKNSSADLASMKQEIESLKNKVSSIDTAALASSKSGKTAGSSDKFSSADLASMKQEIESLKNKVSSIDTTALASSKSGKTADSSKEIMKLNDEITNLKIKMAGIEASTAVSSKGSKASLSQTEITKINEELDSLKKSLVQTQKSYVDVAKRVNSLEDRPVVTASSGSSASSSQIGYLESRINSIKKTVENVPTNEYVQTQISKSTSKTSTDIKKIENRLNELEKSGASSYKGSSDSSSSGSSAGTITKISLGLTLVAALFIAR